MIIITGPTACGKTPTAVALAKKINGEIVSADSMQVYRGMDIGTAKPDMAEREEIPHHLMDIADPAEDFSAAMYQKMAKETILDIQSRGKIPIMAGGTGFYINSVIFEKALAPEKDDDIIRQRLWEEKPEALHSRLKAVDPISAERIHPNNIKRIIRALAYYESNGKPISSHLENREKSEMLFRPTLIILHRDRAQLYEAINRRAENMISKGLEEEVKNLLASGVKETATAMQAIGYKEMLPYIKGRCTIEEAVGAIRQNSRRYAKRQLTYFRHQMKGHWLSMDGKEPNEAAEIIMKIEETK